MIVVNQSDTFPFFTLISYILNISDHPVFLSHIFEPGCVKMCLMPYVNNKSVDQPAHQRSLISTFVVRCLDSTCILVISKVSC